MGNPKDEVARLLQTLPDDATYEDIQYRLCVLAKIKRGLDRATTEGAVPHETTKARLGKWQAP